MSFVTILSNNGDQFISIIIPEILMCRKGNISNSYKCNYILQYPFVYMYIFIINKCMGI